MAICETRDDINKDIAHVLDKFSRDYKKERVEFIDDLIGMLQFERRLALLTDEQIENMNCILSIAQKARLDNCNSGKEREAVFAEYARINYIRGCEWASYLNGFSKRPPVGEAVLNP